MGGRNYNLSLVQSVLESGRSGFPSPTDIRLAEAKAAERCARGEHRAETDAETGDEVCRWCKAVVEP